MSDQSVNVTRLSFDMLHTNCMCHMEHDVPNKSYMTLIDWFDMSYC
jgi:hypothetical protein